MPLAHHLVARARPHRLLFADPTEGARLWQAIAAAVPEPEALTLMPNHVHLVHARDVRRPLAHALCHYVRWRNHRRGEAGPLLQPLPPAEPLVDAQKLRRTVRYVHLNPCRARLVADPLAWPWSTHRDRVGLALDPVVERAAQPHRFHRYVSGDPTVDPEGTELPLGHGPPPTPQHVRAVVASLARVPSDALGRRGRWRTVWLGAALALCDASSATVRAAVGVGRGAVVPTLRHETNLVRRVLHDPRFQEVPCGRGQWG